MPLDVHNEGLAPPKGFISTPLSEVSSVFADDSDVIWVSNEPTPLFVIPKMSTLINVTKDPHVSCMECLVCLEESGRPECGVSAC